MLLRKTRDFGDKISDTVQYIRTYIRDLLMLYLVFVVPVSLVAVLIGSNAFSTFASFASNRTFASSPFSVLSSVGPSMLLAALLYIVSATSYATVMYLHMRMVDEQPGKASYFNDVASRFFPKFLTNLLYMIILVVIMILSMFLAIIPVLGIIALLVGWFWAFFNLSLMLPANTVEDHPMATAIQRAFTLMQGEFWASFGFLFIIGLIFYFFSMIISLIVMAVFGVASVNIMRGESDGFTTRYFLVNGIAGLIGQVFYIIIHVGTGMLFFSLREQKEGGGLESRIDTMGGGGSNLPEEQY